MTSSRERQPGASEWLLATPLAGPTDVPSSAGQHGSWEWTLAAGCVLMLSIDVAVLLTWRTWAPGGDITRELLFAFAWLLASLVALAVGRIPQARLMLALTLVLAATLPVAAGVLDRGLVPTVLTTVGIWLIPLQTAVAGHVLLGFPDGRLQGRSRLLVLAGYAVASCEAALYGLASRGVGAKCADCAENALRIVRRAAFAPSIAAAINVLWLGLACAAVAIVVTRYRKANARQRRILALPYIAIVVTIASFAGFAIAGAMARNSVYTSSIAVRVLQAAAMVGVPLSFGIGLLRERLAYARVSDLVRELDTADADVEHALAVALGDPDLRIALPVQGRYVDLAGRPLTLPAPGDRGVTYIGSAENPFAVVIHDAELADEPALLAAVRAAAGMRMENTSLHAQVQAQLEEVRASRARLVAASDEARRRIERDLHDGAQQRLLAVGLALQLLRNDEPENGSRTAMLDEARDELANALRELRELAAGIHPATLTDHGLVAALGALATHTAVPLRISADDVGRMRPEVEAAAYFAVNEAVANAVKHSGGAEIDVTIRLPADSPQRLLVTVSDSGVGGANPDGSGLRGLVDRLATVDGTLKISSPPSGGTTIDLVIPCA